MGAWTKRSLAAVMVWGVSAMTEPALLGAEGSAGEDRAGQVERRIGEARERLALTGEQAAAVAPILKAGAERQAAVLKRHGIDPGARDGRGNAPRLGPRALRQLRREMDAVRAETVGKLAEVLDREQVAEYRKIQDENRREMRRRIRAAR